MVAPDAPIDPDETNTLINESDVKLVVNISIVFILPEVNEDVTKLLDEIVFDNILPNVA